MSGHGPQANPHDPFHKKVAVFLAVYAALLAFTTMLTNQARTSAILLATDASNQWAFFQAKSTKGIVTRAELELLEHLAPGSRADASPATMPDTALASAPTHADTKTDAPTKESHAAEGAARTEASYDPQELRARLVTDLKRYDVEKDEIQKAALEKTDLGHHQQHREHLFEYAATISELAIVIAGVALLMNSNAAFLLSVAVAAASAILTGYTALT